MGFEPWRIANVFTVVPWVPRVLRTGHEGISESSDFRMVTRWRFNSVALSRLYDAVLITCPFRHVDIFVSEE